MTEDKLVTIFDDEDLVQRIGRFILNQQAGTVGRGRPLGCFLIVGTIDIDAIARDVASLIFNNPQARLRYDLSNYQEKHRITELIGFNGGLFCAYFDGTLTAPVYDRPASVVVFDSIDRAHSDFDVLLIGVTQW